MYAGTLNRLKVSGRWWRAGAKRLGLHWHQLGARDMTPSQGSFAFSARAQGIGPQTTGDRAAVVSVGEFVPPPTARHNLVRAGASKHHRLQRWAPVSECPHSQ
jgi:hypothetical protein